MTNVEETGNFPTADSIESPPRIDENPPIELTPEASAEAAAVEAVLFAADKPLSPSKISDVAELGGVRPVRQAVEELNGRYERDGRSFRIVEIAGGYQMQTLPQYAELIGRLNATRSESRLSQAALETLAIVAYRQPVLRADVEAIRGVACGEVLRGLMEKNLVRIAGRAEVIGRPMLYGTTNHFLEVFGLGGLKDLPDAEQLREPVAAPEAPASDEGGEEEEVTSDSEAETPTDGDERMEENGAQSVEEDD
ncbi:MAG: SMC-Scp complex subunit ScpB [Planctomycetota bacterium]|jgi:segregation and condensation protein B